MMQTQEHRSEEELIKNIIKELSSVPKEYLQTLHAMIHSFRTHLPAELPDAERDSEDFDWDGLVDDIYKNRRANNEQFNSKTAVIN